MTAAIPSYKSVRLDSNDRFPKARRVFVVMHHIVSAISGSPHSPSGHVGLGCLEAEVSVGCGG